MMPTWYKKGPVSLWAALALTAAALATTTLVQAQAADQPTVRRSVDIPAGPLQRTLRSIAREFGVSIAIPETILAGKRVRAIAGEVTLEEALDRSLADTGLDFDRLDNGVYTLVPQTSPPVDQSRAANAVDPNTRLEEIIVSGARAAKLAEDANLGLLGNLDRMDTPFSVTSFTEALIDGRGATTIGEVLEASSSVQRTNSFLALTDAFNIRGFSVFGPDIAFDGSYGIANTRRTSIATVERIELQKGPSALLNGVPPNGGIGGTINLIPKRPTDDPLTNVTLDFIGDGNIGGSVDVSRRFGADNAFGIRFNGQLRDGPLPQDYTAASDQVAALAFEYERGPLQLSALIDYQNLKSDAPPFVGFRLDPGLDVPKAPDNTTNAASPFTFTDTEMTIGQVRIAYDLSPDWTVTAGVAGRDMDEESYQSFFQQIINAEGDAVSPTFRESIIGRETLTGDVRLNGSFVTGPIRNKLAVSAYWLNFQDFGNDRIDPSSGAISNIYDLVVNHSPPDFSDRPVSPFDIDRTLQGIAIANTFSDLNEVVQLMVGVRRQNLEGEFSFDDSFDKSATTPAFALLVRPIEELSIYASYIEALSDAPSPPGVAVNFRDVFAPATSEQIEVGLKFDIAGLAGGLAAFEITQPSGILDQDTLIFSLDGEQRNRGVELEVFGNIGESLRILTGVTYLDAELVRTQDGANDGQRPVNLPEWVVTATADYDTPIAGLTVTGRVLYNSSRENDVPNDRELDGFTRVDLGASYSFDMNEIPMIARAQVFNVFENDYFATSNGGNNLLLGVPRYVALSLSANF